MVESNNFAKGWIWGDKVYNYDREERDGCGVGGCGFYMQTFLMQIIRVNNQAQTFLSQIFFSHEIN